MQRFAMVVAVVLALGMLVPGSYGAEGSSCANGQCSQVATSRTTTASQSTQCANGNCKNTSRPSRRLFSGRLFSRLRG
jgi:hypothetical protein